MNTPKPTYLQAYALDALGIDGKDREEWLRANGLDPKKFKLYKAGVDAVGAKAAMTMSVNDVVRVGKEAASKTKTVNGVKYRILRDEDLAPMYERFITEAFDPSEVEINRAHSVGRVAVVAFEVVQPEALETLRMLGWDGTTKAFALSNGMAKRYAHALLAQGDAVAAKWLRRGHGRRIWLWTGAANLLVNAERRDGRYVYSHEPGSLDSEAHRGPVFGN
jgi:hypothetical protein